MVRYGTVPYSTVHILYANCKIRYRTVWYGTIVRKIVCIQYGTVRTVPYGTVRVSYGTGPYLYRTVRHRIVPYSLQTIFRILLKSNDQ